MAWSSSQRLLTQRAVAVLLAVLAIPVLIGLFTLSEEAPIREGEPAPRTVIADQAIRIVDEAATEAARRTAAESVEPVRVFDPDSQATTVRMVRNIFTAARQSRQPITEPPPEGAAPGTTGRTRTPLPSQQLRTLQAEFPELSTAVLRALIGLTPDQIDDVESETIGAAQQLARLRIEPAEVQSVLDEQLPVELAVRSFPGETAQTIVDPVIRWAMQPTVRVDPDATADARQDAADDVPEVVQTWRAGETIVRDGQEVSAAQMDALAQRGLVGTEPWVAIVRAMAAMGLVVAIVAAYLRRMQPRVWRSGRKALLLGALTTLYAGLVGLGGLLTDALSSGWWYALPAGGLAMLVAILVHPVVAIATMLPASMLVLLVAPEQVGPTVFAATVVLMSVPLVTDLSSRADLKRATLRGTLAYPVIAVVIVAVFGPRDELLVAAIAGISNGLLTAVLVQGMLPFVETLFRLPTVTALLDLADRNHPLLRELEQKALGSYNHSVMVASLTERGCREIGANVLLGTVAALYHDIGKVRRPHFFIENQQGITNPHDELEPEVSAVIIQEHVEDGVRMAREYRLPPEVVACIGSHHGTMLVTYFYRRALDREGGDIEKVDVDHFRYKGTKPRSKESAILLMADCCEATTRSMAMDRGTLPREEIESTVDRLIQERVDDEQFADSELTFREMSRVRDSIVEALVGIYHPRIAYPGGRGVADERGDDRPDEPAPTPASTRS